MHEGLCTLRLVTLRRPLSSAPQRTRRTPPLTPGNAGALGELPAGTHCGGSCQERQALRLVVAAAAAAATAAPQLLARRQGRVPAALEPGGVVGTHRCCGQEPCRKSSPWCGQVAAGAAGVAVG